MNLDISFAWWCFLFPLIGAALTPILARLHPQVRDYGAVFFAFLGALASGMLLPLLFRLGDLPVESQVVWLAAPVKISLGVLVDPLSIVVANVVA